MSYASWWQGDYQQPVAADSLSALADTYRNWIAIIVTCYQETHTDTAITCDLPRTPTDEDLRVAISQAHELGLQVMLKPHLDLNNDPDHWRGDIGEQFTSEAEWSAWFAAYKDFITHYAALAEAEGVAQFAVGTELVGTSSREEEWRAVVTAVREQFSGSLVYASNHGGEESEITWWDALDYIGVDAYYSLANHNEPTQDELKDAWATPLATLTELATRYKKPVIITEIGYRSLDGATQAPWQWTSTREVDLQEQADAYQAALEVLCPQPWLAGIYWWFWSPRPEGGEFDMGYTPRGKPAEDVLRTNTCLPSDLSHLPDDTFLDAIEQRTFLYFWQEANPETGLVKDRANNFGEDGYNVASTAATGFGLTAICIGKERGWITEEEGYERALTTLRFYQDEMENVHGFYYHFVDVNTGERVWESEISSIDTALFLAGALTVGQCFPGTEVEVIANHLYEQADFQWLLTDGGSRPEEMLLGHGWKPETGFLPYRWDTYSELMILYLLAIGSPTYPIPAESWAAWARPEGTYAGYTTFAQGPLFTHQYSHAWVDFRGIRDNLGYDYFESSVNATLANRQFVIDNKEQYLTYDDHVWGLTASDGPDGRYHAYSAPPGTAVHDGTIAPSAAAGSIVFTPELSIAALRTMVERYGTQIWGRYGFSNAFNMDQGWWDTDTIGIDAGITLLMIENHRSGFVWQTFMAHSAVQKAMQSVGFVP